jgi:sulfate transport system permease protein
MIQTVAPKSLSSASSRKPRRRRILPGFGLTLGVTVLYLSLIVLIPLSAAFVKSLNVSWAQIQEASASAQPVADLWALGANAAQQFWRTVSAPRMLAAYRVSLGTSLAAALINGVFGLLLAWVLVRYHFPGKKFIDAMVDLPFALPTAVAGIALTALYAPNGWVGQFFNAESRAKLTPKFLADLPLPDMQIAYTQLGITIALIFIGIPFVVRTVQPVLEDLDTQFEEAAASLGATPWQTFRRVIFPELLPSLLTGFAMAFARALGEYGSVVFISGNLPMKTEIVPLMIIGKLEQYSYSGAAAIAVVMLVASFIMLLIINLLQRWSSLYRPAQG